MVAETPIGPLLQTVFASILEVFLLCLAGYVLAGRGVLDKKTQKQINRLNVSLFTPALLFSKVAFFLSPERLRELWIIPIFFVVVTVVSMSISLLLGWIFRLKKSQRSFAMAAAMFMNSNSLPIALMQSLVVTVPELKWGSEDNKNAMLGRALTYLVLYSTLGMVLRWSYGVKLLSQADDESGFKDPEDSETSQVLASYQTNPCPCLRRVTTTSTMTQMDENREDMIDSQDEQGPPTIVVEDYAKLRPPFARHANQFYRSFPNSPNESQVRVQYSTSVSPSSTSSDSEDSDEGDESTSLLPTRHRHNRHHHHVATATPPMSVPPSPRRLWHSVSRTWSALNDFMTVPLWAALASLLVACIRPIQHAMEWHMQPVKGAVTVAGNCSIPLTLVVLGAYFYPTPTSAGDVHTRPSPTASKSSSMLVNSVKDLFRLQKRRNRSSTVDRPGETATVVIAIMSRMIITPMLLFPLMALSTKFDLHSIFEDPVFVVANVLLISSPPALTLAQITQQAASGDAFERLISRTIFWSYCVVTPPTTIINVVLGLLLVKL
jgi:predicted permease